MDLGKTLQENPALVGVIGAVIGFLASQAVQIWRDWQTERRAIAREQRADRRALRDARLARLRRTFEPYPVVTRPASSRIALPRASRLSPHQSPPSTSLTSKLDEAEA
jgi:hypothetical protein